MKGNLCFVMMPFAPRHQAYYEKIFTPAIRAVGLNPVKVDEIYTPMQISENIYDLISKSDIILVDVTGKNPNVNYELGIAHALGKKTVILTQRSEDVPFDYQHLRYIIYETQDAGWEEKLKADIRMSLLSGMSLNNATTNIAGDQLTKLFKFLVLSAMESSYVIGKDSNLRSDLDGNCIVRQKWVVKAVTDVTHLVHGVVTDEPGAIRLTKAYDRTNATNLDFITTIGEPEHARYVIFFTKTLKAGEVLHLDVEFRADSYLGHLFQSGNATIFQRPNPLRSVLFANRKDTYTFPRNEFTERLTITLDETTSHGEISREIADDEVTLSIEIAWKHPFGGPFSYRIDHTDSGVV